MVALIIIKFKIFKKNMEDLKKIKEIQNWNTKVFQFLYDKYIKEIYRFIYLKTLNKEETQDITSETFVSALQNIWSFDTSYENSNFRSWLYKIAYNKVKDFYKRSEKEDHFMDNLDLIYDKDLWKNQDDKDLLKWILWYLETLKKNEKEVIIYRVWFDLSFKEISNILDISVDNCKKISSRTIKKIIANFLSVLLFILIIF